MAVSKHDFKLALAQFAASVTVVTTRTKEGAPAGITVTAFSSLSLDPPLVLVCIDKRARLHDHLEVGRHFIVNILAADQEAVSNRFASRSEDPFAGIAHSLGPDDVPAIDGAVAGIECRVVERLPGGDHTIIVGEVDNTRVDESRQPLLYARGGYRRLARISHEDH